MLFSEIFGLQDVKQKLIQLVDSNHLAHALLFSGTEGGANLALGLAFATYLNCTNRKEDDACGECPSCVKKSKHIHPDVNFAFPVTTIKEKKGKELISINFLKEWRNFLIQDPYNNAVGWNNFLGGENKQLNITREESRQIIKHLSLKSFEGEYKIMFIWLPEYMHPSAANAILKILEEPPGKTVFLLISNDQKKLLSTILSRTQIINIRPFTDDEIREILIQQHFIDKQKADQVTHLVDGNIQEALRLSREVEDDSHKMFRDWMRTCYKGDLTGMVHWSDRFNDLNKAGQQTLFSYGLSIMRESLISMSGETGLLRILGEELDFSKNLVKVLDTEKISLITDALNSA
ncbi:MAG: DNA polymerase III subunit delta, partial [Candidatus Heimdallarchaeota archaeon]|nr:DNA polymerase III subunit delta [Candidatus Heimdallarchaeota archaeon]